MIKHLRYCLFILFATTISCGEDQTALFNMELTADFEIPAGLNTIETYYFPIENVPTFYNQYLNSNGINDESVKHIYANRAVMFAKFINIDMDFVQDISILGARRDDPDSDKEFFYFDLVDINEDQELELFSSINDLKDIVSEEYIDLIVRIKFRAFTPTSLESRIDFSLSVFDE